MNQNTTSKPQQEQKTNSRQDFEKGYALWRAEMNPCERRNEAQRQANNGAGQQRRAARDPPRRILMVGVVNDEAHHRHGKRARGVVQYRVTAAQVTAELAAPGREETQRRQSGTQGGVIDSRHEAAQKRCEENNG